MNNMNRYVICSYKKVLIICILNVNYRSKETQSAVRLKHSRSCKDISVLFFVITDAYRICE